MLICDVLLWKVMRYGFLVQKNADPLNYSSYVNLFVGLVNVWYAWNTRSSVVSYMKCYGKSDSKSLHPIACNQKRNRNVD